MRTCVQSTFKFTLDVFHSKVIETWPQWSQVDDGYQIARVNDYNSIMVMNVSDFEAIEAFMTNDDTKAWDVEWGCVNAVQSVDAAQ